MENVSRQERACIQKSHEAKLSAAKARLADLEKDGMQFDSPIRGLAGGIEWHEGIGGIIIQIALLPLVLVFVLISFAVTPITYIQHLRKVRQKRNELEREIQVLEGESLSDRVPDDKDIESLWRLHGLSEREYSLDMRLTLLDNWIGILYGKDVSKNLGLRARGEEIAGRNLKANQPYYRREDAPHFLFVSPVDSLARQLSEELPPYQ